MDSKMSKDQIQEIPLEHHVQTTVSLLKRRVKSAEDIADLFQDAFLRMYERLRVKKPDDIGAYLYRIARNLSIDQNRERARTDRNLHLSSIEESHSSTDLSPLDAIVQEERLANLHRVIAKLPLRCRETFLLHAFYGLPHAEIAKRLNISRSMVEKHITKALRFCRTQMRDYY